MSEIENLISGDKPILVNISSSWCGPCRMMNPILSGAMEELGDSVTLLKIEADENKELMVKYGVRRIPTLILFKGGVPLWKYSGVIAKNRMVETIQNKIK